jgi:hypothetical protein
LLWDFDVLDADPIPWKQAFPRFYEWTQKLQPRSSFDIFKQLPYDSDPWIAFECRLFLAFAYTHYQGMISSFDRSQWAWSQWIYKYRNSIRAAISFNYELLIEDMLTDAGLCCPQVNAVVAPVLSRRTRSFRVQIWMDLDERRKIFLMKPHGSIDMRPTTLCFGEMPDTLRYPPRWLSDHNETSLEQMPRTDLRRVRVESNIVVPLEHSRHIYYQRSLNVRFAYGKFQRIAKHFTHCIFIGLSYEKCDRQEQDFILNALGPRTHIIVANPEPPVDFIEKIQASHRPYDCWLGDPTDL